MLLYTLRVLRFVLSNKVVVVFEQQQARGRLQLCKGLLHQQAGVINVRYDTIFKAICRALSWAAACIRAGQTSAFNRTVHS
jgi:hypothetical protein